MACANTGGTQRPTPRTSKTGIIRKFFMTLASRH
jgi:hypothetical protein